MTDDQILLLKYSLNLEVELDNGHWKLEYLWNASFCVWPEWLHWTLLWWVMHYCMCIYWNTSRQRLNIFKICIRNPLWRNPNIPSTPSIPWPPDRVDIPPLWWKTSHNETTQKHHPLICWTRRCITNLLTDEDSQGLRSLKVCWTFPDFWAEHTVLKPAGCSAGTLTVLCLGGDNGLGQIHHIIGVIGRNTDSGPQEPLCSWKRLYSSDYFSWFFWCPNILMLLNQGCFFLDNFMGKKLKLRRGFQLTQLIRHRLHNVDFVMCFHSFFHDVPGGTVWSSVVVLSSRRKFVAWVWISVVCRTELCVWNVQSCVTLVSVEYCPLPLAPAGISEMLKNITSTDDVWTCSDQDTKCCLFPSQFDTKQLLLDLYPQFWLIRYRRILRSRP